MLQRKADFSPSRSHRGGAILPSAKSASDEMENTGSIESGAGVVTARPSATLLTKYDHDRLTDPQKAFNRHLELTKNQIKD
jgi:hypothetical protein